LLFPISGACELLGKLEEIFARTSQGSGNEYLSVLQKTTKGGGEKDALERLRTARLALARYFARCAPNVAGGKQGVVQRPHLVM
jgi:nuclear pore complex protein Nup85